MQADAAVNMQRPITPMTGTVHIRVDLNPPTKREYDPDNKIKALFDTIVRHGLIRSDSNRTIKHHSVWETTLGEPGAYLTVEPCT